MDYKIISRLNYVNKYRCYAYSIIYLTYFIKEYKYETVKAFSYINRVNIHS